MDIASPGDRAATAGFHASVQDPSGRRMARPHPLRTRFGPRPKRSRAPPASKASRGRPPIRGATVLALLIAVLTLVPASTLLIAQTASPAASLSVGTGAPASDMSPGQYATSALAGAVGSTTGTTARGSTLESSTEGSETSLPRLNEESARLDATGSLPSLQGVPRDAIYPPNPHLLSSPPSDPSQAISPGYRTTPAPIGLADYGLGAHGSTYSEYASDVLGTVRLNSYDASAGPLFEDTGAYYWNYADPYGNPTPWQSSLQMNTVVTNVSYPGANNGSFWTQSVVSFQGPYLQLIDNVWNVSNPYEYLAPDTLFSYGGVAAYPEFYYDDGPTLPVAYPMAIQLYNNATVIGGRSAVTFGYRIAEPGHVYTGVYDEVVFNSTPSSSVPLLTPDYLVSGTNLTPAGLLYDAELVFGGPGSGANAMISSLNGSESIDYLVGGGWVPARAAYDYGTDTGETSVGIAGWYQGTTEQINQGPSMLYGLWNARGGVPSGNIAVHLTLDPVYQFVFIGTRGTALDNESYAPSTAAGTVQTWLPPGSYKLSGWADGFDAGVRDFCSSLSGTLLLPPDPGVWDAPVYMDGSAQARALGTDATGWGGVGPVRFANLSIDLGLIFNHVNDFGYTEFSLFWAYGFGSPQVSVSNVTQGPNFGNETLYLGDVPGEVSNVPDLGDTFEAWDVSAPQFANLTLSGVDLLGAEEGGAVAVWDSPRAAAFRVNSTNGSLGFWAANSRSVSDSDSSSTLNAFALNLMGSPDAVGTDLSSNYFGYTVQADGSDNGRFTGLQALFYSVGFTAYSSNGTRLTSVIAEVDSTGVDLVNTLHDRVTGLFANSSSLGVFGDSTSSLSIVSANVSTAAGQILTTGVVIYGGNWTNISGLSVDNAEGVEFLGGSNESLRNIDVTNGSLGALFIETGMATVESFIANNSLGVFIEYNLARVSVHGVVALNGAVGVAVFLGSGVRIGDVEAYGEPGGGTETWGVGIADSNATTVTGVRSAYNAEGVNVSASSNTTVSDVRALLGSDGVEVYDSSASVISRVLACDGAVGVSLYAAKGALVQNVYAGDQSVGVLVEVSHDVTVRNVVANYYSYGVYLVSSTDVTIRNVRAYHHSIAVYIA